jgi:hypothetical protein
VQLDVPEPVVPEHPIFAVEQEALLVEPSRSGFSTNVLDEVGGIEPDAALTGTGPIVAYVPSLDDTQPIPPYGAPTASVISEPERPIAAAEPEPVAELEPVAAVAAAPVHESIPAPEANEPFTMHAVEAAAAAVVGSAALAGAAHFFTVAEPEPVATASSPVIEESAPLIEESAPVQAFAPAVPDVQQEEFHHENFHHEDFQPEVLTHEASTDTLFQPAISVEPATEPEVSEPELPGPEPVGDAALAEELAAALAAKEAEDPVAVTAEAANASAEDLTFVATSDAMSDAHEIADRKLSEAVSRALEKLRPQIIAEILKEMMK